MSKRLSPAIKLVNAVIRWYSKPKRYVKNGWNTYEGSNGECLDNCHDDKGFAEANPDICRACLIGSVRLQGYKLGFSNGIQEEILRILDDLPSHNGYSAKYNSLQAKNQFIKVKNELLKQEKGVRL